MLHLLGRYSVQSTPQAPTEHIEGWGRRWRGRRRRGTETNQGVPIGRRCFRQRLMLPSQTVQASKACRPALLHQALYLGGGGEGGGGLGLGGGGKGEGGGGLGLGGGGEGDGGGGEGLGLQSRQEGEQMGQIVGSSRPTCVTMHVVPADNSMHSTAQHSSQHAPVWRRLHWRRGAGAGRRRGGARWRRGRRG